MRTRFGHFVGVTTSSRLTLPGARTLVQAQEIMNDGAATGHDLNGLEEPG
jgi:hypothetical protein